VIAITWVAVYIFQKITAAARSRSLERFDSDYVVQEFPHFLTDAECDAVIAAAQKQGMEPSRVYSKDADLLNPDLRVSEQAWIPDSVDPVVKTISERTSVLTNMPVSHQEQMQVVHYDVGGKFTPHYDACDDKPDVCARLDERGGQRYATLLIYLNDGFEGGGTNFPKIGKSVIPEKGKAVLFYNVRQSDHAVIPESMHEGAPVTNGEKWVANKWVRVRPM
jgi:prolyl 4-hydroxylase